jgi:hypothetical protein
MTKDQVKSICEQRIADGAKVLSYCVRDRNFEGAEMADEVDWIVDIMYKFDGEEVWGVWRIDDLTGDFLPFDTL